MNINELITPVAHKPLDDIAFSELRHLHTVGTRQGILPQCFAEAIKCLCKAIAMQCLEHTSLLKCDYTIDGDVYSAVFNTLKEAQEFVADNRQDGTEVIVLGQEYISAEQFFADTTFERSYRVELIGYILLATAGDYKRWDELDECLKYYGVLVP